MSLHFVADRSKRNTCRPTCVGYNLHVLRVTAQPAIAKVRYRKRPLSQIPQIGCKQIAKVLHVTRLDMTCPFSSYFNYMLSNAIHNLDFVSSMFSRKLAEFLMFSNFRIN